MAWRLNIECPVLNMKNIAIVGYNNKVHFFYENKSLGMKLHICHITFRTNREFKIIYRYAIFKKNNYNDINLKHNDEK